MMSYNPMKIPFTHCCVCCTLHPEREYTHKETHQLGAMKYKYQVPVPMCSACYQRVVMVNIARIVVGIGISLFGIVTASEFLETDAGRANFGLGMGWALAAFIIAFVVAGMWMPRRFKTDFITLRPDHTMRSATVSFSNPAFQRLYEEHRLKQVQPNPKLGRL
jgi:hypothetical protein